MVPSKKPASGSIEQPSQLYRNSINLDIFSLEKNCNFLEKIWALDSITYTGGHSLLTKTGKWFDRLHNTFAREPDPTMTLERFIKGFRKDKFLHRGIEFGHHKFFEIRYCAMYSERESGNHYAWLICPYSENNYGIISGIFSKTFGRAPESIPVSDVNKQQYERLEREYGW